MSIEVIKPDWPAANNIHAFCTTRKEGVSTGNFTGLNLALHVDDNAQQVLANRQKLKDQFKIPEEPLWLDQVHGNRVVNTKFLDSENLHTENNNIEVIKADASFSEEKNKVCAVMTADCLPILICNRKGTKVAAAHAGWRGLADDIIESTIASLSERPNQILVWLGPAIGSQAFEVGEEVFDIFVDSMPKSVEAFKQNRPGHYLADIYLLAKLRLKAMGIDAVYGGDYCTFTDVDRFYSYRRDDTTGRQASVIWFE